MSDTIDGVLWTLEAGDGQFFRLPECHESWDANFLHAIQASNSQIRINNSFHNTHPLWYGLWMQSPLSPQQCDILCTVFVQLIKNIPQYEQSVSEFLAALELGATGQVVHVGLPAPMHVDMGLVTTFVHCPRCKAEGPFERWKSEYPSEPIVCPVCSFSYSPATTHSYERDGGVRMIVCDSCDAQFRPRELKNAEREIVEQIDFQQQMVDELEWLYRVKAFYNRYPEAERRIDIQSKHLEEEDVCTPNWSDEDRAVLNYLDGHRFNLSARLRMVEEYVDRMQLNGPPKTVKCHKCGGSLVPSARPKKV